MRNGVDLNLMDCSVYVLQYTTYPEPVLVSIAIARLCLTPERQEGWRGQEDKLFLRTYHLLKKLRNLLV